MNKDKVYLKGHVIGRAVDTLGYQGLMVQLENLDVVEIDKNLVHKEIDEPQKVTVPQFVADWIEYCKENHLTITGAFEPVSEHGIGLAETFKGSAYKCTRWALDNQNLFARAWLDGYEVEEEKQYIVKFKNIQRGTEYLKYDRVVERWYFGLEEYSIERTIYHTLKELEEAGFGWVFDCPGVEIEEVE